MKKATNVLQVLKAARKLIAAGWTRNTYARRKDGTPCNERSPVAARFCAMGAIDRAAGDAILAHLQARNVLREFMGDNVVAFNDTSTKARVLAAFDKAIASASKKR